jgi:hypothetical protein
MAPAADMFELGVKVQVLRRGTMFAVRAARLYELYSRTRLGGVPAAGAREDRERDPARALRRGLGRDARASSSSAIRARSARAERDPRHKMALVFRWYLGKSSKWSIAGERRAARRLPDLVRARDGGLQRVGKGSFLAEPARAAWSRSRSTCWRAPRSSRAASSSRGGRRRPAQAFDTPAAAALTDLKLRMPMRPRASPSSASQRALPGSQDAPVLARHPGRAAT